MKTDELLLFLAVADTLSFHRAAERLGLAQSQVSIGIAKLESRLERRLLHRTTRSVELTSSGEIVRSYARNIDRSMRDLQWHLSASNMTSVLDVGVDDECPDELLSSILQQFRSLAPHVAIRLRAGSNETLRTSLANTELDAVLRTHAIEGSTERSVESWPLYWIGRTAAPSSDDPIPIVVGREQSVVRRSVLSSLRRRRRRWVVAVESDHIEHRKAAVAAGLGFAAVPSRLSVPHRDAVPGALLPELDQIGFEVSTGPEPKGPEQAAFLDAARRVLGARTN